MRLLLTAGLRTAFFLYIQVLLTHSLLQHRYAAQHRLRHRSAREQDPPASPAVDVWLPCYNEDPALLAACCASLDAQDYAGRVHIFLVDDGSSNRDELEPVYERYRRLALDPDRQPRWTVIGRPRHEGKRGAQEAARRRGGAGLVLTIDSDTEIAPDGISRMVAALADPAVGAIVGRIGVRNASSNRLTRTIEQLYWLLFEQERSARARFHSVLCCAGAFSLYRRAALERCWDGYLNQVVCGKPCNSGDDLHLTSLILADGYLALYQPDAVADMQVPATVRHFLRQQVRWWRSFYRELGQVRSAVRDRHWFLAFDVVARGLPPVLLAGAVVLAGAEGVLTGFGTGLRDLGLVALLVLTHGSRASGQAADLRFFRAGVVEALLAPFQFYALLTCTRSDWGRREPRRQIEHARLASRTR